MANLNKVLIIGSPGSGKSFYSQKISEITGLPIYHIDNLYWNSDKTHISYEELIVKINEVIVNEKWILDGNFLDTLEQRLKFADTVFYLDFRTEQCIEGVESRIGVPNDNMPWVEEEFDTEFREFILTFREKIRPRMIEILENYSHKNIYFLHSRREMDQLLITLKNEFDK